MSNRKAIKILKAALSGLVVLCLVSFVQAKTITFKYSDHDPPGGMRTEFLKNVWLPEIEKQTGGKVKVQDFWGAALLNSKEIFKGIADGITDAGFVYPGHYPGQLVAFTIFKLFPRGPSKFENMVWFYHKVYEEIPEFTEELKRANQKTLLFTAGLPGAFTGKNPLSSLNDIKGDKWRAGDKWALRFLKNAGAIPVSVPWGDVYMALQTGTIDGCFTNYDGLHMMKFDEVAPNLLVSKELWYAMPFIHNVNLDYWNALPKDVQQGILKACEIAEQKFARVYENAFDKIMAEQKAAGFKVTVMSKQDVLQWENAEKLGDMQEQWVKEAVTAGLKTAPQILEKMRGLHKQAMERE
ncbi:MAG: TRAP transporter substrate-binding protein DctP [Deltaproteobacteria bacterium]|nr:TRAP transporter substrate-binding protein DctP [Deltaproteobacteria bacterium]MBW1960662.1 TRAP transporter substrate-binding protein DctP [Deltaproteobacteria bacterium]MBW1994957.1 TRAP transporter substrate-binding protein DctP [Deltaproteobacteria bacterium]MBW2152052.1 TRAP transporter substrate-binding protein DctP [Deltaproteobacteria bacterium]